MSLTEPRPAPLNLTDTEILDFLDEYCYGMTYVHGSIETPRRFILECEMIGTTKERTIRDAVCLAAAKVKECNE